MTEKQIKSKLMDILYKNSDAYYAEVIVLIDKIYDLFKKEWKK